MPYRIPKDKDTIDCTVQTDEELLEGVLYCGKQAMDGGLDDAIAWYKLQSVAKRELLFRCLEVKKGALVKLTRKQAFRQLVDDLPINIDFTEFTNEELKVYHDNLGDRCMRVTWSHRPISLLDPLHKVMREIEAEQERRTA